MKKLYTLLLLCFCTQLSSAINEVPNPGFETWTSGEPDLWITFNEPGAAPSVTQSAIAHTGTSSAKGQPVIGTVGDTVAPMVSLGTLLSPSPISQNYENLEFYYQSHLTGGDIFNATVFFLDATGNNVALGVANITANTVGWTHLSVPMHYSPGNNTVSAVISFSVLPSGTDGRSNSYPASYFYLDDVSLTGVVGVEEASAAGKLAIYPIPAHDAFTVEAAVTTGKNATLVLTDVSGRVVRMKTLSSLSGTLLKEEMNVEGIRPRLYSLMILNDDKTRIRKVIVE